jgi:hypothetical protein
MQLTDNSEQIRKRIQQQLVGGLNNANEFLINEARTDAPVKSGDLRDGTQILTDASEADPVATGASKMPYAAKVNRGTSDTEAKPFWTNSWIRMKAQMGKFFSG